MYLSSLLIETGSNPDRPRPGRLWLRNVYRVHQRLCMAFPSGERPGNDPDFLKPYAPADFAQAHVHVKRSANAGFLFRIDPQPGGRAVILVLSALRPDWDYAFHNADYLLAGPAQCKPFEPRASAGQRYRFRLLANAVYRATAKSRHSSGEPVRPEWIGKRIGVGSDAGSLRAWLERRAAAAGFSVSALTLAQGGWVYMNKSSRAGGGQRLRSIRYEGLLQITDAQKFCAALTCGIGPGKAFGFGLLSIAPAPAGS